MLALLVLTLIVSIASFMIVLRIGLALQDLQTKVQASSLGRLLAG